MSIDFAAVADSMTTPTPAQMVTLVTNAIAAVTLNQSYVVNGRTVTRADLLSLEQSLVVWKQRAALVQNLSPVTYVQFERM